jgi:single-stranded-DNA-specific exonuclease
LLLTDDEQEAATRANALETINRERQEVDKAILKDAVKEIEESVDLDQTVGLVLAREIWHPGVIGIVASRLVERYARPTVLIGIDGQWGKGSGRSVPGFDLHGALSACAQHLTKFGGHKMAAGLTVACDAIEPFREAFNVAAQSVLSFDDLVHTQRVDAVLSVDRLDDQLERLLRHFEPCGVGNPAPVLAVRGARAAGAREVGELHLKFTIEDPTGRLAAIGFGLADRIETAWLEGDVDVAFRLEENVWQGLTSLQARVIDLRPAGQ